MNRIALAAETLLTRRPEDNRPKAADENGPDQHYRACSHPLNRMTKAVVSEAGMLAEELAARLIIVASASGATALSLAKNRFRVPAVGVSDSPATLRRISLYWGMTPLAGAPLHDSPALVRFVTDWGKERTAPRGRPHRAHRRNGHHSVKHNLIVVHEVE